jgi:peptidyl carrier protein
VANDHGNAPDQVAVAELVTEIWNDVLDVRPGQAGATFFELQGQSISAVRIVARISDELGIDVDMGSLFEDPDVDTFVREVLATAATAAGPARRSA